MAIWTAQIGTGTVCNNGYIFTTESSSEFTEWIRVQLGRFRSYLLVLVSTDNRTLLTSQDSFPP